MSSAIDTAIESKALETTELSVFDNQISGHSCLLKGTEGSNCLYKPYDPNESQFYEYMSQMKDHPLYGFIPKYYGNLCLPKEKIDQAASHALQDEENSTESDGSNEDSGDNGQDVPRSHPSPHPSASKEEWMKQLFQSRFNDNDTRFLKLQDLTSNMELPCMLDLKMGSVAYNAKKMDHQAKKLRKTTSYSHKFRICGLQVKNVKPASDCFRDKYWGRKVRAENINNAMALFFYDGQTIRRDLIKHFISQLEELANAIRTTTGYNFYSVSLLMIYDSAAFKQHSEEDESVQDELRNKIKVRLIDFAHTVQDKNKGELDDDLLTGIENLIKCLACIHDDSELEADLA